MNFRCPAVPRKSNGPLGVVRRKTLYVVPTAPGGWGHFQVSTSVPSPSTFTLKSVAVPGGPTGAAMAGTGMFASEYGVSLLLVAAFVLTCLITSAVAFTMARIAML